MARSRIILATALFALVGCGGSSPSSTSPPPPSPTLTVSPTSATVTAGGAAQAFAATLTNSSATISWTLSPSTGTLSATTGASVAYTPPASVASAATVTLTATAAGITASAPITVNPAAAAVQHYTASASVGDFLQVTVNSTAQTISYQNLTNGTSGSDIPYTVNADGTYAFTNSDLLQAYELPGYALVMLVKNAGTTKAEVALVTALSRANIVPRSYFGARYNYFKMKQSGGGIQVGALSVNAAGVATGSIYLPGDSLITEPTAPTPWPKNVHPFELISAELPDGVTPVEYVTVPTASGTASLFGTSNHLWVVDETDGTTLGLPGASDAAFPASFAGNYHWLWFKKVVTGTTGTGTEIGTVSSGKASLAFDATGFVTQTDGTGATVFQGTMGPVANAPWLYGTGNDGRLTDPCYGVFTLRKMNQTGDTRTDAFLVLFPGTPNTFVFAKFVTAFPVVDPTKFTYVYGIAVPKP